MNIFKRVFGRTEKKSYNPFDGTLMQLFGDQNSDGYTMPTYENILQKAYKGNDIVFFVVNDIAKCVASIPIDFEGDKDIEDLFNNPQRGKSKADWIFQAVVYKLLSGSIFAEVIKVREDKIKWMNLKNPAHIQIVESNTSYDCDVLEGYRILCGQGEKFIKLDPITGKSNSPTTLFHSKFFDPEKPNHGLSPLVAGMRSVDPYNEASALNNQILKNDGSPAGFITLEQGKDAFAPEPDQEQMKDISDKVNSKLGRSNRGRWAVFNWNFKFQKLGQNNSELNVSSNKETTAREIARVFGYPAFLLGFTAGSTFNNVEEAKLSLWTNTIIPIAEGIIDDFRQFFATELGREVQMTLDTSSILALQPIIKSKRNSAREDFNAGIISLEEARAEGNYPEDIDGTIFIPSGKIPLGDIDDAGINEI